MRPLLLLALAACALGSPGAPAAPAAPADPAAPAPTSGILGLAEAPFRSTRSSDRWLELVSEYAREAMSSQARARPGRALRPLRLELPLALAGEAGGAAAGGASTLPLLVLPVPVYVDQGCSARRYNYLDDYDEDYRPPPRRRPRPRPRPRPYDDAYYYDEPPRDEPPRHEPPRHEPPRYEPPRHEPPRYEPPRHEPPRHEPPRVEPPRPQPPPPPTPTYTPPTPQSKEPEVKIDPRTKPDFPKMERVLSSKQLIVQFRAQVPSAPHLPPAVFPRSPRAAPYQAEPYLPPATPPTPQGYDYPRPRDARAPRGFSLPGAPARRAARSSTPVFSPAPAPAPEPGPLAPPPRPRFSRSLMIRAELTVPRSDYTEPYTVWYDAESGAARTELHGGATTTLRQPAPGGLFHMFELTTDNSGGQPVRRCGVAPPLRLDSRRPPALPDLELFEFDGYLDVGGVRGERWRRVVASARGAGGAARGEQLTHTHELLLTRSGDSAVPIKYSVSVDSSVLGARCDAYEHRYLEVRELPAAPAVADADLASWCQQNETLDARRGEHAARLDPLREFTLPARDPRYDDAFKQFSAQFEREYADPAEEAVRKNLMVQHTRFVSSCNRQGARFEAGVNFLGDRLDAELDALLGAALGDAGRASFEEFPHAPRDLRALAADLPEEFDWRNEGAVTPVRYQGSCSSCWAMAVTGAVEGALFVRTRRLVPLAEQALVDCAHSHGAHGCNGTWPSRAYDYVQERGLPALADYGAHKERVEACRAGAPPPAPAAADGVPPVTRISAHVNVTRGSVPALKVAIRKHAPTVVIIDAKAKSFIFYKKGVLQDDRCGKKSPHLNHAVLAVGWGAEGGEPHFIVKNSWSAAWGEGGAARLQAPSDTCGVLQLPSYPRLEQADVLRGT